MKTNTQAALSRRLIPAGAGSFGRRRNGLAVRPLTAAIVLLSTGWLSGGGCIERKETITISRDGSVMIDIEYKGTTEDLKSADALPSKVGGWDVARLVVDEATSDKDREEIIHARRRFEADRPLPGSYAGENDPNVDLYLSFPTSVQHTSQADNTYFSFRRTYGLRRWAYVQYWEDRPQDKEFEELTKKATDTLSHPDRVRIIKVLMMIEGLKQIALAHEAVRTIDPDLAQRRWLAARRTMLKVYEGLDYEAMVNQAAPMTEEERDAWFGEESRRVEGVAHAALRRTLLSSAGYNETQIARLDNALDRARLYHKISAELGTHSFTIRLQMPGEVVGHNADKVEKDGTLVWEFQGDAVRDRAHELMATSRVPNSGT